MGRPKKKEPTRTFRAPESFVKRVRRVAAHLDRDAGDYLAERFGPLLEKDERKMIEDMGREQRGYLPRVSCRCANTHLGGTR